MDHITIQIVVQVGDQKTSITTKEHDLYFKNNDEKDLFSRRVSALIGEITSEIQEQRFQAFKAQKRKEA